MNRRGEFDREFVARFQQYVDKGLIAPNNALFEDAHEHLRTQPPSSEPHTTSPTTTGSTPTSSPMTASGLCHHIDDDSDSEDYIMPPTKRHQLMRTTRKDRPTLQAHHMEDEECEEE